MARHIIFDLDGTLVDSVGITVAIVNRMLEERGASALACPLTTRAHVSAGGEAMIAAVLGPHCDDAVADIAEFRRIHNELPTPPDSLFPNVIDVLRELQHQGFTLAICSNKPQNLCEKVLADLGMTGFFQCVVGWRSGIAKKPAPDLLQLAMDGLGATPDDCLFVGDSELDLLAARSLGMRFVLAEWGYLEDRSHVDAAPGGVAMVNDMAALHALISRVAKGLAPA